MSDTVVTGIFGVLGFIITALVAPQVKTWFDNRRDQAADQKADKTTAASLLDKTLDRVLTEQARLRDQLNDEIRERDAKIAILEAKVDALMAEVRDYKMGVTAPAGFISLPVAVWRRIPEGVIAELPGRPYPGEEQAPRFGSVAIKVEGEEKPR